VCKLLTDKNNSLLLPKTYYLRYLQTIGNIKFTFREVDILAFLLNGRSSKKIANVLGISPRTVENHSRNIMLKINCNSREAIIDFLERSEQKTFIKEYYDKIISQTQLETLLRTSNLSKENSLFTLSLINCCDPGLFETSILPSFKHYLSLTGLQVHLTKEKPQDLSSNTFQQDISKGKIPIYFLYFGEHRVSEQDIQSLIKKIIPRNSSKHKIFLVHDRQPDFNIDCEFPRIITLLNDKDSSFLFLNLFEQIFPTHHEILSKIKNILLHPKPIHKKELQHDQPEEKNSIASTTEASFLKKNIYALFCLVAFLFTFWVYKHYFSSNQFSQTKFIKNQQSIDLTTPSIFLERTDLLHKIHSTINSRPASVRKLALVGIGGSGKTILARQLAKMKNPLLTWELNGASQATAIASLIELAFFLAKNSEEEKEVSYLQRNCQNAEKSQKLIFWIQNRLKSYQSWFFIIDNVERLSDIQHLLPQENQSWGNGTVILTTRNSNIQNNNYLHDVFQVPDLSPREKQILFEKIMFHETKNPLSKEHKKQIEGFLRKIPPFPLDVISAAYYLKTTHISYKKYMHYLNTNPLDFIALQENLLKDSNAAEQTRYKILSLSFQQCFDNDSDSMELLFFMGLLNSNNIPRELLINFKSDLIVDRFVYKLKEYSLISNISYKAGKNIPTLSMNQSIQEMSYSYLMNILSQNQKKSLLPLMANALQKSLKYSISRENFPLMKILSYQTDSFLKHQHLLNSELTVPLNIHLAGLHFYLGHYSKAKKILTQCLSDLEKYHDLPNHELANLYSYLGIVERELGFFHKAKHYLKKSYKIYQLAPQKNAKGLARTLDYLGIISRENGNFSKSKDYFEKSYKIYQTHLPGHHEGQARVLGGIGIAAREMGDFDLAEQYLKSCYNLYQEHGKNNHVGKGWALIHLGRVYKERGDYTLAENHIRKGIASLEKTLLEKDFPWGLLYLSMVLKEQGRLDEAQTLAEKSVDIYKKSLKANHVYIGWSLEILGSIFLKRQHYSQAETCLLKALTIYKDQYKQNHLELARLFNTLGHLYLLQKKQQQAYEYLSQAFQILKRKDHPEQYISLERLSELGHAP
tara:strand:+ start:116 stop:3394 length:3279 start_codon:yes stop_codon:yes gene_type:complete